MDYKTAWEDTKRWLDDGLKYMKDQMNAQLSKHGVETKEYSRLKNKHSGLQAVRSHMSDSERIYNLGKEDSEKKLSIICHKCGEISTFNESDKEEGRFSKKIKVLNHHNGVRFVCANEDCGEQTILD